MVSSASLTRDKAEKGRSGRKSPYGRASLRPTADRARDGSEVSDARGGRSGNAGKRAPVKELGTA